MNSTRLSQFKRGCLGLCLVLLAVSQASAKLSLAVRFPDVVMGKLEPGGVYNLRQIQGIPFVVINQSDIALDVVIESVMPGKLEEGYEKIVDPEWVTVVPNRFRMAPNDIGTADIALSIPDDPSLIGRHFQAKIKARTTGHTGMLAVAVGKIIRFSVGIDGPEALKKQSQAAQQQQALVDFDLDMNPKSLRLQNVPLGKKIDILKFKRAALKLVNQGYDKLKLRISSVKVDRRIKHPDYELTPDPSWLSVKPSVISIKPDAIKKAKMYLKIPKDPKYAGKKFMFVIRAELKGMDIPLELQSLIYVTTERQK